MGGGGSKLREARDDLEKLKAELEAAKVARQVAEAAVQNALAALPPEPDAGELVQQLSGQLAQAQAALQAEQASRNAGEADHQQALTALQEERAARQAAQAALQEQQEAMALMQKQVQAERSDLKAAEAERQQALDAAAAAQRAAEERAAQLQLELEQAKEEPADVDEEPLPPLPEGTHTDSFGVWPRPMPGGNNNYMQFRRHFRVVTATLYRMLHGSTSNQRINPISLAPLEGMLWLAVKFYCVNQLLKEHESMEAEGGVLQDSGSLDKLRAAQELCETAKTSRVLSKESPYEASVNGNASNELKRLVQTMKDLRLRGGQVAHEGRERKERMEVLKEAAEAGPSMPTPRREELASRLHQRMQEQEREVIAQQEAATTIAISLRSQQALLDSRQSEMQQLREQLLHAGQGEEAANLYAQIPEVSERMKELLGKMDALEADRREAERGATDSQEQLKALQAASARLQPSVPLDEAGTSASHARYRCAALQSELRQANSRLLISQLETRRRESNIRRLRSEVNRLGAELSRQQEQMASVAVQLPIPRTFEEGRQANREAMDAMHERWRAANIIRGALTALEEELQMEQAAAAASAGEQLALGRRITELTTELELAGQGPEQP